MKYLLGNYNYVKEEEEVEEEEGGKTLLIEFENAFTHRA